MPPAPPQRQNTHSRRLAPRPARPVDTLQPQGGERQQGGGVGFGVGLQELAPHGGSDLAPPVRTKPLVKIHVHETEYIVLQQSCGQMYVIQVSNRVFCTRPLLWLWQGRVSTGPLACAGGLQAARCDVNQGRGET